MPTPASSPTVSGRARSVVIDPATVQTNIVIFGLAAGAPDAATVVRRAADRGVLVFAFGPRSVRAVTHLDVTREQCERAADILAEAATAATRQPARRRVSRRRLFVLFQEGPDLPSQFVLDVIDRAAGVEDAEVEFVGHRGVFAQQPVLVGAKAVVDVVAVLQVHP